MMSHQFFVAQVTGDRNDPMDAISEIYLFPYSVLTCSDLLV